MEQQIGESPKQAANKRGTVTRKRAWKHLLGTTPWVVFFSGCFAYTILWVGLFFIKLGVERPQYYQIEQWVWSPEHYLPIWFIGFFLPVWFFFSLYGFWVRMAGPDRRTMPTPVEWLLLVTLTIFPWWWLMLAVKNPRIVFRNYRRRFLGETQYFMDDAPTDEPGNAVDAE